MVRNLSQRDYMRQLIKELGYNKREVCRAYAEAERKGIVIRRHNIAKLSVDEYAEALWADGERKRWF